MRMSIFIKSFLFSILLLITDYQLIAQSQGAPESMNYQAVIRDGSGNIVANQSVGIRIDILQGSATGTSVYQETFTPTTNAYGSIAIQIGSGTVISGTFSTIDWGAYSYYVETAVDIAGGTNYSEISTTQFVSVPYALYAKNAGLDSAAIQGMIDASGGSSSGNEVKSFAFPEGLNGSPIIFDLSSGDYTVPSGKRIYVLNLKGASSHEFKINNVRINDYQINYADIRTLSLPIIANDGDILSGTDAIFNGILINTTSAVTSMTFRLMGNTSYTVPNGKNLYILNYNSGTSGTLYINGTLINEHLTNSSTGKTLNLPIVAKAGELITGNGAFNGYVVSSDYFQSSSSSGSSSTGSDANTLIYTSDGF